MTAVLGSFDTGFYGITLVHADSESAARFQSYADSEDTPELSATGEEALGIVGLLSAPEHEVRHFHDFLLSPLGVRLMALRFEATITGVQAIRSLMDCPQRYLPVPMGRWMEWNEDARNRWLQSTGVHFGIPDLSEFVPLPTPERRRLFNQMRTLELTEIGEEEALALTAEGAVASLTAMAKLRERGDSASDLSFVSADDVFEGGAHLVQAQAVWRSQGEKASAHYMDHIYDGGMSHLRTLNLLLDALQKHQPEVRADRLSELYTWMLLGAARDDGSPSLRYSLVLMLAFQVPQALLADCTTEELWDLLDRASGQSGWRGNLQQSLAGLAARQKRYREMRGNFSGEVFDALFDTAERWLRDSAAVTQAVLSDPAAYARPLSYVTTMAERLPIPFVRRHFNFAFDRRDEPLVSATMRAIAPETEPRHVVAYVASPPGEVGGAGVDSVVWAMKASFFVNYGFFGDAPDSLLHFLLKEEFKAMIGKELVHIY